MPNAGILVKTIGLAIGQKLLKKIGLRGDGRARRRYAVEWLSGMSDEFGWERL
jgi:hypothetical protein